MVRKQWIVSIVALIVSAGAPVLQASPVVDGTFDSSEGWGSSIYSIPQDSFGPGLEFYSAYDATKMYGAIVSTEGSTNVSNDFQPYLYSDDRQSGAYGDGDDFIIYGNQRVAFARDSSSDNVWEYSPSTFFTLSGGVYSANITDEIVGDTVVDTGVSRGQIHVAVSSDDTVFEYSIDKSLLGDYSTFEYNGRFFNYFNNSTIQVAAVPEPTSLSLASLSVIAALVCWRSRSENKTAA